MLISEYIDHLLQRIVTIYIKHFFVGKLPYCYEENTLSCFRPAWKLIFLRLRQDERLCEKLHSVKHICFYIFS